MELFIVTIWWTQTENRVTPERAVPDGLSGHSYKFEVDHFEKVICDVHQVAEMKRARREKWKVTEVTDLEGNKVESNIISRSLRFRDDVYYSLKNYIEMLDCGGRDREECWDL